MANLFSFSCKILKEAKMARDTTMLMCAHLSNDDRHAQAELAYETAIRAGEHDFKEVLKINERLQTIFNDHKPKETAYFVTVRPDEKKCNFTTFVDKTKDFVDRKPIDEFQLSFEQKGNNDDDIGVGFHAHMMIKAPSWRSKGECLRAVQSTFKDIAAPNCIQVEMTKTPDKVVQEYLVKYQSKDGHKIITKESDDKWRQRTNIPPLITTSIQLSELRASLSSPMTGHNDDDNQEKLGGSPPSLRSGSSPRQKQNSQRSLSATSARASHKMGEILVSFS